MALMSLVRAQAPLAEQPLVVAVFPDRGLGGVYLVGEMPHLAVLLSEPAHVYLFTIDAEGRVGLLFPNPAVTPLPDNRLPAGMTTVPRPADGFTLVVSEPLGVETFLAVASPTPLPLSRALSIAITAAGNRANPSTRQLGLPTLPPGIAIAEASVLTQRLPSPQVAGVAGQLTISTPGVDALAYVNGRLQGIVRADVPLQLTLPSGTYQVLILAPGRRAFVTTVSVQGGQLIPVTAALPPVS